MSVDFRQVQDQVVKLGQLAPDRARKLKLLRQEAGDLLDEHATQTDLLRDRVEAAAQLNRHLRSALPLDEPLNTFIPLPSPPPEATILAADGSQIFPDRHGSVFYSLINVGAIRMQRGSDRAPVQTIRSRLLYDEDLYTENGRITERLVALMRDLSERKMLADLAADLSPPLITLTDGPLELWDAATPGQGATFQRYFEEYLVALQRLQRHGASTAGYIDKPSSDLVIRLLEIARLPAHDLTKAGKERPYRGLTDAELLQHILPPGARSALFEIQSPTAGQYHGDLTLHFFYLNVAAPGAQQPYLARVEVPAWVAQNRSMIDQVHAVLVEQCAMLGARPYPYLLHRSHEVALVSRDEKEQVETMIVLELRKHGLHIDPISSKSAAKLASAARG